MAGQRSGNSVDDPMLGMGLMLAVFAALAIAVWIIFHTQISASLMRFYHFCAGIWLWAPFLITDGYFDRMTALRAGIRAADPSAMTFMNVVNLGNVALRNLLPFFLPIMFFVLRGLYRGSNADQFTQIMDFEGLIKRVNTKTPASTPVLHLDLVQTDPDVGPWRRMDDYITFSVRNGLLRTATDRVIAEVSPDIRARYFDHAKACQVFQKQLGPKTTESWEQLRSRKPQAYVLAAAFCARINREKLAADALLDRVARTFVEGDAKTGKAHQIDVAAADRLWKKYSQTPKVLDIIYRHAYLHVSLAELLHRARYASGVLHPAWFLWLKPVDRTFWYAMHQVGMRVGTIEAGGVRAHYLAELKNGGPLDRPTVGEAATALRTHLISESWLVDDAQDVVDGDVDPLATVNGR